MRSVLVRMLEATDIPNIAAAFAALGWKKPTAQYERYLVEQHREEREVLVACHDEAFAGYQRLGCARASSPRTLRRWSRHCWNGMARRGQWKSSSGGTMCGG